MKQSALLLVLIWLVSGCVITIGQPIVIDKPPAVKPGALNKLANILWYAKTENPRMRIYYLRYSVAMAERAGELLDDITKIAGIQSVTVIPFEFSVYKSRAYKWIEIQPKIKKLVKAFGRLKPKKIEPEPVIRREDGV